MAATAQAATIQLSLDAFRLTTPTSRWTLQLRILAKDGSSTLKAVKLTNIRLSNLSMELSSNNNIAEGILLDGTGEGGIFSSANLALLKTDPSLPAVLTFDLLDADTGQALTSDEFGMFFYGLLPVSSSDASDFTSLVISPILEPGPDPDLPQPPTLPVADPDPNNPDPNNPDPNNPDPNNPDPNNPDPNNPDPNNPDPNNPDPNNPDPNTPDPNDPSQVPEPSTFLMVAIPLGIAAWRLKR